jgi:hypothetical protein
MAGIASRRRRFGVSPRYPEQPLGVGYLRLYCHCSERGSNLQHNWYLLISLVALKYPLNSYIEFGGQCGRSLSFFQVENRPVATRSDPERGFAFVFNRDGWLAAPERIEKRGSRFSQTSCVSLQAAIPGEHIHWSKRLAA